MNIPASASDATQDPTADGEPVASPVPAAPISCETAVRRLWDYLDGGLAAPARGEVEAHLATCADCPPHFAFAARTLDALAAARPDAPSPDEDAALRVRVQAALNTAT
jgi:anti-sigma factor RsiW